MANWIYIAGAFTHLDNECGQWLDNDPHIWTTPFTWGICRPDLRTNVSIGDYIFFVLPKASPHPQMVFAYLKINEIITHDDAFHRHDLKSKRMRIGANPNGNILVGAGGHYNKADGNVHLSRFKKLKKRYVVGCIIDSKRISVVKIRRRSEFFLHFLNDLFEYHGSMQKDSVLKVISRKGRKLDAVQVTKLLQWIE